MKSRVTTYMYRRATHYMSTCRVFVSLLGNRNRNRLEERERQRDRETETETDRQTDRERERKTERPFTV